MNDPSLPAWLPFAIPLFFAAMWLISTTLVGLLSGWFSLQQWYADDSGEEPLLTLRGQTGLMGTLGVRMNNMLILGAGRRGLSLRVWRFFAPFQKPLLIPWSEIRAEESSRFFTPMVKLTFGEGGKLKIYAAAWAKLVGAVQPEVVTGLPQVPPITKAAVARGLFFEWLALSAIVALAITVPARLAGDQAGSSFPIAVVLPVIIIGIAQFVRYAKQS